MQRISTFRFFIFLAILTGGGCSTASPPAKLDITPTSTIEKPRAAKAPTPVTLTPKAEIPIKTNSLAPSVPTLAEKATPVKTDAANAHIGVILPLNTTAFRQPAEDVKQGLLLASKLQPGTPPIRIYPTSDETNDVLTVYQQALNNGAKVIIGPLTKSAIAALADSNLVNVPTLALSVPDIEINNRNLYLFGLSLDVEARQVAQLMHREGRQSVLIIGASNALSKRLQSAFSETWQREGGKFAGKIIYSPNTDLNTLHDYVVKTPADAIFLALTAHDASLVRPYLLTQIASYATSQIFTGLSAPSNVDLAGVRFLDMPWLLQPDHPAVMVFNIQAQALSTDSARLYAMGIDAYRLAQLFFLGTMPTSGNILDGVSGQIRLNQQQFTRELTAAEFQANTVVVLDNVQP